MSSPQKPLRRTKIVATLGPATDDPAVLREMLAVVDVVRLNFSHGDWEEHQQRIQAVRSASEDIGRIVAILGDLQGPKIRIQSFADGSVELEDGAAFVIDCDLAADAGDQHTVGCAYADLPGDLNPGDELVLDDGQLVLKVDAISGSRIETTVTQGGTLSSKKGINRRGGGLSAGALTDKDFENIRLASEAGVDWLAVSFVRDANDMEAARTAVHAAGGHAHLVAKIERTEALTNLEEIIQASDAVMVARGDLGVEVGYAGLTGLQKKIIRMTREGQKAVITATQMMESMIHNAVPTRAEVSDVANAVMDGTDAVMLSAESAVGKYPVEAVTTMGEICRGAENYLLGRGARRRRHEHFELVDEAIANAVMYTSNHLDVRAIIALTESGSTARWMSRLRSDIPIFAFTRHAATARRVVLYRGVYPVPFDITCSSQLEADIFSTLLGRGRVSVGDLVVFTRGDLTGVAGHTNAMVIVRVTEQ